MFISFDIKFIRRDQKTHRNGELGRAIPRFLVKPGQYMIIHHKTPHVQSSPHLHLDFIKTLLKSYLSMKHLRPDS